jgi:hypothetical protein
VPDRVEHSTRNGSVCHDGAITRARSLEMETEWGITAAVVPAALTIGGLVMILAAREYQIAARLCFALAGAWLGVVGFMWLIHTPASPTPRIAAGLGIGVFVFVVIPLLIRAAWPPDAQAQNPPNQMPPPVTMQGGTAIFNYGTAGNITQNSENKTREAMRDPDGIYQLDQKVATVVSPEVRRSESLVLFKSIQDAQRLDIGRDFQWREYIIRYLESSDQMVVEGAGLSGRKFLNVRCSIVGIVSN